MTVNYIGNQIRRHNKWFGYARMCPQFLEIFGIETLYERLCTGTLNCYISYVGCAPKLSPMFAMSRNTEVAR